MRENGTEVIKEPFTDPEKVPQDNSTISLVAFNTDGCRTLLTSFPEVPNIVEKTIRYSSHFRFMEQLKDGGFFDKENLQSTAKVLIPHWKLEPQDKEFTFMKVSIKGSKETVNYSLYDEWKDGVPSMARTTGYTCNAVVNLLAEDKINKAGLYLPEELGEHLDYITDYLNERDVKIKREMV